MIRSIGETLVRLVERARALWSALRLLLVALLAVTLLAVLSLSCANKGTGYRGAMVLDSGVDKKSMSPGDELRSGRLDLMVRTESSSPSAPELEMDEAGSLRTAQANGVWGQTANAQETSATGRKPMIVYHGQTEIKVSQIREASRSVLTLIKQFDGYMSNMEEYYYEASQNFSITARIPSTRIMDFLQEVKKLGEVISTSLSGDEVTEEYFDLQARLEALHVSEARLAELLSRSGKLSDLKEIERELTNRQQEINQVEGRMRYLRDRSDLGTLEISLVTEAPPKPSLGFSWDLPEVFGQAWLNLKYTLRGFTHGAIYFVVNAIFWLPILAVIVLVLWYVIRRMLRSGVIEWETKKEKPGGPPSS